MNEKNIDKILNNLLAEVQLDLEARFHLRLSELNITQRTALEILKIERRTLQGILNGDLERLDFVSILKVGIFLKMETSNFIQAFLSNLEHKYSHEMSQIRKQNFLFENFDIMDLKKRGILSSIDDSGVIETTLKSYFGVQNLMSILEFKPTPLFNENKNYEHDKHKLINIDYFYSLARHSPNPNEYNRDGLLEFMPKLKTYTSNVEFGLAAVQKELYKLGITVIFKKLIGLRGLIIVPEGKPFIAISDNSGFYPTLWFTLAHELHHALYDLEYIEDNHFLVDEDFDDLIKKPTNHKGSNNNIFEQELFEIQVIDQISSSSIEIEANEYSRNIFLHPSKIKQLESIIGENVQVGLFAHRNGIHPSFIYMIHAYIRSDEGEHFWARYRKFLPSKEEMDSLKRNLNYLPITSIMSDSVQKVSQTFTQN